LNAQSDYLAKSEQQARKILGNTIQALGGQAYLKVTDSVRKGKAYSFSDEDIRGLSRVQFLEKYPRKIRVEYGKQDIVYINNEDKSWKIEYKVVKEQTAEELAEFKAGQKHNLDNLLRFRLNEEGMRIRYLGQSRLDLIQVEGVQLIDKEADKVRIFIDASTFLPVKMEFQTPGRGKRWTTDDERFLFNYHTVEGIQVPFGIRRTANGEKASELQLESVQINTGLEDSIFQPILRKN
jgi:outer membrane lipoprotein-sorting protein